MQDAKTKITITSFWEIKGIYLTLWRKIQEQHEDKIHNLFFYAASQNVTNYNCR